MTLTYIGPTVGDGDLIVPAASEVALDPLLAEAVLLLRASSLGLGWVPADGWANEGTGGSALDAVQDGGPDQVAAELVESGVQIADETNDGYSTVEGRFAAGEYGFAIAVATLDLSGDFTVMIDFTPNVVPQNVVHYLDFQDNILGQAGGVGLLLADITQYNGGNTALIADGGATFPTDFNGVVFATSTGRQMWVMRVDRDSDELQLFDDGATPGTPAGGGSVGDPADISGIGDVTPVGGPGRIGPAQIVHNVALWDRALTDTEITVDLPAALG